MAKKMLGKVVAGAALGGASLLVFAPGIAFADNQHDGEDRDGKVIAKPHVVKAGDKVKLLEICPERQEHAFVWSKVTGKVELKPVDKDRHDDRGEDRGGEHGDWKDKDKDSWEHGKDEGRGDEHGKKDDHGKDDHGKDGRGEEGRSDEHGKKDDKKDDHGKDDKGRGEERGKDDHGKGEDGKGQWSNEGGQPPANGAGGGFAADAGPDRDAKNHEEGRGDEGRDDHGKKDEHGKKDDNKKDEHGKKDDGKKDDDKKGHDGYGQEEGRDRNGHDENGRDDHSGYGDDEDRWEHEKDFVYYGEAKVSEDARPGKYELKGSCGEGKLVVLPRGGVDGGDGGMTSTSTDRGMALGGAGMIGAAALGGIVLMRRRRADGLV
ncbi:hypothetical protein AB0I37_14705 [Micromonospora purpureochromogenes]|uniref:hypothetical protein n=1 Tax=Micromonospora purpureochromogenes TaxID=47872 RepID=UPI00340DFBF6